MKAIIRKIIIFLLTKEAQILLKKNQSKVILVAGSVGKTSTKDAIYDALSGSVSIRKNQKSMNSDFGVPLSILGLKTKWGSLPGWLIVVFRGAFRALFGYEKTDWLVLEVGADHPGDVRNIVSWLKPDIAVLTRMGEVPVHIEFFGSREDLVQEDLQIVYALKPGGIVITNVDDPDFAQVGTERPVRTIGYGKSHHAVVRGSGFHYELTNNGRIKGGRFTLTVGDESHELVRPNVVGEHHMYPALAAVAVGLALELPVKKAVESLALPEVPPGRMRILPGLKGSTLIDDSYNSSPVAVREALKALSEVIKTEQKKTPQGVEIIGRRIAVLGDMKELGKHTDEEHIKIGHFAKPFVDLLVLVGLASRKTAEGALAAGFNESAVFQFDQSQEAGKFLEGIIEEGDVVLIKGSQSIRMERAVKELMAEPERAAELLCRQETEWERR